MTPLEQMAEEVLQRYVKLTPTEVLTMKYLAKGEKQSAIAERLHITTSAVNMRVHRIAQRLGTHNAIHTVVECIRRGWIDPHNLA